jgi:hypothetical protein
MAKGKGFERPMSAKNPNTRQDRLAVALRENLRRRKAQDRASAGQADGHQDGQLAGDTVAPCRNKAGMAD